MESVLTIPELKNRSTSKQEPSLDQTSRQLSQLASLDARESLDQIYETLHESNRIVCRPELRFQMLELYREPIGLIEENLERILSESTTPLPGNHAQPADLMKRVLIEMTYGYKSVVLGLAKTQRPNKTNGELSAAIHRSIRYLYLILLHCALYYNSWPTGTWIELHSLFLYARKLDVQNKSIKDALNGTRSKNSIAHAYQQALLFGLSDPYRHPVNIISKIHRYLDFWASDTHVSPFAEPPSTRCQFIIDPGQDRPAQPYAAYSAPKKNKKGLMLLDTRGITKTAHTQWRELDSNAYFESAGLSEDFFDGDGKDMLQWVISAWGIAPRRQYPRNAIAGTYQLVIGVNASHYLINGGRCFKSVSDHYPQTPPTTRHSSLGLNQPTPENDKHVTQSWQGENESSHGLCLCVDLSRPAAIQVSVGEVVAFRLNRDQAIWSAALVRWVRLTHSKLRIGLLKLGNSAQAIAIKPVSSNADADSLFKNSFLIPKHEHVRYANCLITPPGMYESERELYVDNGKVVSIVRAGELLERSRYYEWFGYEFIT